MKRVRMFVLIALPLAAAAPARPQPNYAIPLGKVIPQIAAGGSWELELQVLNLTDQVQSFAIDFRDADEEPLPLRLWDETGFFGTDSSIIEPLRPNGLRIFRSPSDESAARVGFATFSASPDSDGVAVWAVLTQKVPDRPDFQLAVPNLGAGGRQRLTFRNSSPFTSSMALVGAGGQDIRLVAYAADGEALCSDAFDLLASHQAFLVEEALPCSAEMDGIVEIRVLGDGPGVYVLGVTANDFGAFTTQLPIPVP